MARDRSELGGIIDASIPSIVSDSSGGAGVIAEGIRSAVLQIEHKIKANGRPYGVKTLEAPNSKPLTGKMKLFASHVIGGMSTKQAYRTAYDAKDSSEATVCVNANRLLGDERISKLIGNYLEQSTVNILTDQASTRRHILQELLSHSQDKTAQLSNRLKALEMMGRSIGMFDPKTETTTQAIDVTVLKKELETSLALISSPLRV
jgi:hypothetical protein